VLAIIKLGGSVISDKKKPYSLRYDLIKEIGEVLRESLGKWDIILVHGGGSFGHPKVKEIMEKNLTLKEMGWEVIRVMSEMSVKVTEALGKPFAPYSTPSLWANGVIVEPLLKALEVGWVPVLQGNVVPPGKVISGDEIVRDIALKLKPDLVALATDVDGVYPSWPPKGEPLKRASPCDVEAGGSQGIDVTGGMKRKLKEMNEVAKVTKVIIFNGLKLENYRKVLEGKAVGTELVPC